LPRRKRKNCRLELAREKRIRVERDAIVQAAKWPIGARLQKYKPSGKMDPYVVDRLMNLEMEMDRVVKPSRNGIRV
jgi:hypothetical protein